jgi:RNA recognition motif-containing protein
MKDELESIPGFKRVKVIKNEEERLGAEKGSVFAEFHSLEGSEKAMKKLNGRIYDGRKIRFLPVSDFLLSGPK